MKHIKQGDRVKHLSGGPLMIAYTISNNIEGAQVLVCCRWFDSESRDFKNVQVYRWELESVNV